MLRFGDVTVDGARRLVSRGARQVHLTPTAYRLLEVLLARRPQALSKAEILEEVWPGVFVTQGSLSALVKDLRKALGESARAPSYVRTVYGYGYAFEAAVHEVAERTPSRHRLVWGATEMTLAEGSNVVGRDPPADVWICHPSVSREHARIVVAGEEAVLEDLGSKNGTWRGQTRVTAPLALADGDELRVGAVHFTYRGPPVVYVGDTVTYA